MNRRITALISALLLLLQLAGLSSCAATPLQLLDRNGNAISAEGPYAEIALKEATEILIELEGCTEKQAKKLLSRKGYILYTAFDPSVYQAIDQAYEEHRSAGLELSVAVTDQNGRLAAVYSASQRQINRATALTPPYSAFKPLSVYAPAIDQGLASWATMYPDEPVKQVNGQDWPSNPNGSYSHTNTPVATAIQRSLNTIAVRCLQEYGVSNSIQYLKTSFGLSLNFEESKANTMGEEEVLGNIALGYLNEGVSPVDMAGYYRVFAAGGEYLAPKAVLRLCDAGGKELYTAPAEGKQVMKETTAVIMNRLLQKVTAPGGTGSEALFSRIPVAGKTGTGEEGNWFVGVTPQYSCAVWHGNEYSNNLADTIFADIMAELPHTREDFNGCAGLQQAAYCAETGLLYGSDCRRMETGWFAADSLPEKCKNH
ncbi:MAG: hypothetical protein IJ043_00410 [Clostridia bacterium]|nr:hypothetical protein [Clostridia bacterium]